MEKEVAVREWCIEKAIQMGGKELPCKTLRTAKLLEEYLKGNIEVTLESFDGFNIKCEK